MRRKTEPGERKRPDGFGCNKNEAIFPREMFSIIERTLCVCIKVISNAYIEKVNSRRTTKMLVLRIASNISLPR